MIDLRYRELHGREEAGAERGQRAQYIIKHEVRDEERRAEVVAEDGIDE